MSACYGLSRRGKRSRRQRKSKEKMLAVAEEPIKSATAILRCPISREFLEDPVVVEGVSHSYAFERKNLEEWMRKKGGVFEDPLTREVIKKPVIKADKQRARLVKEYHKALEAIEDQRAENEADFRELRSALEDLRECGESDIADEFEYGIGQLLTCFSPEMMSSLSCPSIERAGGAALTAVAAGGVVLSVGAAAPVVAAVGVAGAVAGAVAGDSAAAWKRDFQEKRAAHRARLNEKLDAQDEKVFATMESIAAKSEAAQQKFNEEVAKKTAAVDRAVEAKERIEARALSTAEKVWISLGSAIGAVAGGCAVYYLTAAGAVIAEAETFAACGGALFAVGGAAIVGALALGLVGYGLCSWLKK